MSELEKEAQYALSIVHKKTLDKKEQEQIMLETIQYWKENVNEGFLSYRKSVSNESSYANLDWEDPYPGTAWFKDHRGTRYLDLLGGYGIYNVGRVGTCQVCAIFSRFYNCRIPKSQCMAYPVCST